MRPETEGWLAQGERDLETARHLRTTHDYYAAAFFCHQAAEKGLKALYIELNRESPGPTHSLVKLGQAVAVSGDDQTFLRDLNPEYIVSRYPDASVGLPYENYDDTIAARLLAGTERLLAWVQAQMPKP